MKKLPIYIGLLFVLTCAEDSQIELELTEYYPDTDY